ncbi:DNA-damage-repair/toleration protein 111-like [Rutidosis leptorrhynchoides]|uniref:DNA-damage-repair/toleration protein 111-like n=1 Tax=Rutidosis leptorrhynchoides TaxID=125765 RepID=UPI003A994E8D
MLGGLYGDLPPPSDEDKPTAASTNVWSSATKMAPSTLRKPAFTPQTVLKPNRTLISSKLPSASNAAANTTSFSVSSALPSDEISALQPAFVGATSAVVDEYDPARPNDYEEYRRERKKKQVEEETRRELERRRQEEEERERERERERMRERSELSISGEEAWKRRAAMSSGGRGGRGRSPSPTDENVEGASGGGGVGGFSIGKSETSGLGVGAGGQMTAAQRMMAKMGWKQGQGLGKQEQGITTPLMAKKTDKRAGVIVNASENTKAADKKVKGVNFNGPPTRVLMLRNMVGPGEVDDELEDEVASECAKYGTVTRVLIFEITEPNFPSEEAVRIFIQFERSEETTKAYIDLDGRFFGGRVVRAAFYSEERFGKNELAPLPGEVPGFF